MKITSLRQISKPSQEPLDRDFLNMHLKVDIDEEDQLVDLWIAAARQEAEKLSSEVMITQTWEMTLDGFPTGLDAIVLPKKPVQSILSVGYTDTAGDLQTFGGSPLTEYSLLHHPEFPSIILGFDQTWPAAAGLFNAVTIQFVAGYGEPDDVPELMRAGMALLVGHFYANRENVVVEQGVQALEIPLGIRALLEVPKIG